MEVFRRQTTIEMKPVTRLDNLDLNRLVYLARRYIPVNLRGPSRYPQDVC